MRKIKLSIIIVNYQSRAYLEKCLASIFAKINLTSSYEIIVVNNDIKSELDGLNILFPTIKIIQNSKNNGFGSANNLGAKEARGEVLLFLNPDTEIITQNISSVLAEFENNQALGILGSRIITTDGIVQNWIAGAKIDLLNVLGNNFKQTKNKQCWQNTKQTEVFWVAGTAMFITEKLFGQLGGFDEKFFMYFEDVDLCNRAQALNKKVIYFPDFSVLHHSGKSFLAKKKQKKCYYLSQDYYFRKHLGFFQATLLKLLRFFSF